MYEKVGSLLKDLAYFNLPIGRYSESVAGSTKMIRHATDEPYAARISGNVVFSRRGVQKLVDSSRTLNCPYAMIDTFQFL
jgi:hypothetical protein